MNDFVSDKIKVISFFAILLVLYIHSGFHPSELRGLSLNTYVQNFISGKIGRCAVPLFFMISGYLFFYRGIDSLSSVFEKMKKRAQTLLIPYICAAIFFVLFSYLMTILPGASKFVNSSIVPLFDLHWTKILKAVFIDAGNGSPLAFQLWFLRDLMVILLFSPIWYFLIKYLKYYWLPVVFVLSLFTIPYFPVNALFWFITGASLKHIDINKTYRQLGFLCLSLFILIGFLEIFMPNPNLKYIQKPIVLLGVFGMWSVYNIVVPISFRLSEHKILRQACSFTFLVYLFHEPTLNVFRKVVVFILGKNEIGYLLSYMISPWIYIIFTMLVGFLLKKYIPTFYSTIVGGR